MSDCASLIADAGSGVAPTLQAVDCMADSAGGDGFAHLFGTHGALAPALTAVLTIYVALYGLALMTGRVRLGIGGLSGRMLALGAVLAFATSWTVYGPLVTGLAMRAPDDVAGAILGTRESATAQFAARIDTVFAAVNDAAKQAAEAEAARNAAAAEAPPAPGTAAPAVPPRNDLVRTAGLPPASVATLGAMILLLSTLGVLVTARIVLTALLLSGPLFVVMALFAATRGLFAGWCRTVALAALAPLLVVLGGAFSLELAVPTVARLLGPDGIDSSAATGFFLIATIHAALMAMALRAGASLVAGWKPWGAALPAGFGASPPADRAAITISPPSPARIGITGMTGMTTQVRDIAPGQTARPGAGLSFALRETRSTIAAAPPGAPPAGARRAAGIGSRFRPAPIRQVIT